MTSPKQVDAVAFAEIAINNVSNAIRELASLPDGTARNLDSTVAAGILNAQGNLAIAAALMVVAQAVGRNRTS